MFEALDALLPQNVHIPKGHPAFTLAIRPMFLASHVDWIGSVTPCACHAVPVPEYEPIVSAVTPEHVACPKWPVLDHSDSYVPR